VLRVDDRVRITARLIEAATDRPLWSERYERDLRDVLTLQSEVAATVAEAIQVNLTREDRARLGGTKSLDPRAYEAYLKGRYAWNRRTEDGIRKGIEFFERAIEIDPTYAQAYAGLADSYNILGDNNWVPPDLSFARAKAAAERALELDPNSAEAYTSLGYIADSNDWDWQKARRLYKKAIELGPDYATAHQWYGNHLSSLGEEDAAIAESKRAIQLDPLSLVLYISLGDAYYYAWRFHEAIEQYERSLALEPRYYLGFTDLARSLEQAGRYEESFATYVRGAELAGKDPKLSSGLACAYAYAGRTEDAITIRDALIEREKHSHVPAYAIASMHAALGETDGAIQWLERGLATRDRAMVWMCVNPRFEKLRVDPRFQDIARRVGLPEELVARTVTSRAR